MNFDDNSDDSRRPPCPDLASGPETEPRRGLIGDLKLLFAALGAGTNVVPMGDNGRTTRMLAQYARSLHRD